MNHLSEISWHLGDASHAEVHAALSSCFTIHRGAETSAVAQYLDDADAHLWRAGLLLRHSAKQVHLTEGEVVVGAATLQPGERFWWDYSAGPLQDRLRERVGVRALLPVVALTVRHTELALCDANQKTVVRARLTESLADGRCDQPGLHYLTLKPLRGYDAAFAEAMHCVQALVRSEVDLRARTLLAQHGIGRFKARRAAPMPVTNAMPTEQAVRAMAHIMLEGAQQQVGGVIDDIDTEFLHAYRVHLRKARSLVSLLNKSLPQATIARVKPRLAAMAGATNRLRDLDVYLLAQHQYRALLPAGFDAGMAELAALVGQQRTQEQARVAIHLGSARYAADVAACLAELASPPALETPAASRPVLYVLKRQLLKRYAAVKAMSSLIHPHCLDDDIHAVRIELKKLRYLIEFFASMLPKKRSAKLLADLKNIQGVLGDFNDFSVQVDFLGSYIDDGRIALSRAVSGLTAILHVKKMAQRERIFAALGDYFSENRAIEFTLLFEVDKSGDAK